MANTSAKRDVRRLYLAEWMAHARKTPSDIVQATTADKSLVSRWLSGAVQPGEARIVQMATLFGAERDQLHSPPPMYSTFDPDSTPSDIEDEQMTQGVETGLRGVPEGSSPQIDVTAGMGAGGLTIVSEGVPGKFGMTFAAENISDYWRLPSAILASMGGVRAPDVTFVAVQGDSMTPTLDDGDVVAIDTRHRWPSPDGIYALNDPFGGIIVKRIELREEPDGLMIAVISDNPRHREKIISVEDTRIVGRVLRKFGQVK